MSDSDSDENVRVDVGSNLVKKKRKYGSMFEASKRMRNTTHETGDNCHCKRLECFTKVNEEARNVLIRDFNNLSDRNSQNSYLAGLISVEHVKRRRPRKDNNEANLHDFSYSYKVRITAENKITEIPVCFNAFKSFFGITNRRLQFIKSSLGMTGMPPVDKRGKHENRGKNKLPNETYTALNQFFSSLKGRKAHYSLKDTNKIYLPEHLNRKKLLGMFLQRNVGIELSYEKFRVEFDKCNIGFGYPRSDTCSTCDAQKVQEGSINEQISKTVDPNLLKDLHNQLNSLHIEMELHKRKADKFYSLKRSDRLKAQKSDSFEAITMDFGRNLPLPNITTNDVYYKRQLSFYLFNIHVLSNGSSFFYTYDETVGKKGSNEVVSMLHHFFINYLKPNVREIHIFCDSCGGQNKNYTMIRFLHYMTTIVKRFDTLIVTYPIRGHSYLECDKNMSLIKNATPAETPNDWRDAIREARVKPRSFEVVECTSDTFKAWEGALQDGYMKKFQAKTQKIRQLRIASDYPQIVEHRDTYSGAYVSTVILRKPGKKSTVQQNLSATQFLQAVHPENLYMGRIPLKKEKYNDLQALKPFCRPDTQEYFDALPVVSSETTVTPEERDSDF